MWIISASFDFLRMRLKSESLFMKGQNLPICSPIHLSISLAEVEGEIPFTYSTVTLLSSSYVIHSTSFHTPVSDQPQRKKKEKPSITSVSLPDLTITD